jgi:hypothetical protein
MEINMSWQTIVKNNVMKECDPLYDVDKPSSSRWPIFIRNLWMDIVTSTTEDKINPRRLSLELETYRPEIQIPLNQSLMIQFPTSSGLNHEEKKNKDMQITLLSAALLFRKYEIFLQLFPICFENEQKILEKLERCSKYDLQKKHSTLWHALQQNFHNFLPASKDLDQQMQILMRIFILTRNMKKLKLRHMVEQNTNIIQGFGFDPLLFYKNCFQHVQHLSHFLNLSTSPSRILFPPLPDRIFSNPIPKSRLLSMFPDHARILTQKIIHRLMTRHVHHMKDWMPFYFDEIHKYIDQKIKPYMQSIFNIFHSCRVRNPPRRRPVDKGYAFTIRSEKCNFSYYDKYCLVTFDIAGQYYTSIISTVDFQKNIVHSHENRNFIFLRKGTCTGPSTHPWFQQILAKYHGKVPRLRFSLDKSDGILIPYESVTYWLPELSETNHGSDITGSLQLYQTKKSGHRHRHHEDIDHPYWLQNLPLASKSYLKPGHLLHLAPDYVLFNYEQRILFHSICWQLGGINFSILSSLPGPKKFAQQLYTRLSDWRNMSRELVLSLLPFNNYSDLEINSAGFWTRIKCYDVITQAPLDLQALITLSMRAETNAFSILASAIGRPDLFPEMIRLISKLRLPLCPSPHSSLAACKIVLFTRHVPTTLKRLAWQSLMLQQYESEPTPIQNSLKDINMSNLPVLRIQLPLMAPDIGATTLYFDRHTGTLTEDVNLKRYIGRYGITAERFDLCVQHENGRGQSVYIEILQLMWKTVIEKHIISDYDNMGFCVTPNVLENCELSQETYQTMLFNLGFISGLCLARGLYLPYPLYVGFWRYLYSLDHTGINLIPFSNIFHEKFESCVNMVTCMTNEDLKQNLCLTDNDINFNTREELINRYFLPSITDLEQFHAGWSIFMSNIPVLSLESELNQIFCEPLRSIINFASFVNCFQQKSRQDEIFLRYLQKLSHVQIETLLFFITGKKRLPLYDLGEEKISISWNGHQHGLPIAQNCTHTLIMPSGSETASVEILERIMSPIFQFDTVYGFS